MSGGSYGRGNKRGQQQSAGCNPCLNPDKRQDKLSQAVSMSAEIASAVKELAADLACKKRKPDEEPTELECTELKTTQLSHRCALQCWLWDFAHLLLKAAIEPAAAYGELADYQHQTLLQLGTSAQLTTWMHCCLRGCLSNFSLQQ